MPVDIRSTAVTIDLAAVRHNLTCARRAAPTARICAMVKTNAYGHGLIPVAHTLARAGADMFGVGLIEEAVELRQSGLAAPILVLGGTLDAGFATVLEYNLLPVLSRIEQLELLAKAAGQSTARFHLEIDTGMTRLGTPTADLADWLATMARFPQLQLSGVMTHFAKADQPEDPFTAQQIARFEQAIAFLRAHGITAIDLHAGNSAATLACAPAHYHMLRPGLLLYGINPLPGPTPANLLPVMRWTTRPIRLAEVAPGTPVSYGCRWRATAPSRIATLPVGYGDGYLRALSNRAEVLIRGQRAKVVGTICMDHCMIDVTGIAGVTLADEVVLLGRQGSDSITAGELAHWAGTIPYEIVCAVNHRIKRTYVDEWR